MPVQASDERPHRSTCGQGGAHAQLAAVAELIRPDLKPGAKQGAKRSRTKEIPTNVPVNAMAPPLKQSRWVYFHFHLVYGY
jgi:hypothetical protein